jgi:hypothetical protein
MNKDYLLLAIVTVMSLAANLPQDIVGMSGLDSRLLVVGLMIVLALALVRYAKVAMVLSVVILAFGANLPEALSTAMKIEPGYFMGALIIIVLLSVANRYLKLPSGIDKPQGFDNHESAQALFGAVINGRLQEVSQLIESGLNIDSRSRHGYTPLMIAAARGHGEILDQLLNNGAELTLVDPHGRNALQIAREAKAQHCTDSLLAASQVEITRVKVPAPTS